MPRRPKLALVFAPELLDHLAVIERKHHRAIQRSMDEQLSAPPQKQTRNRKPLDPPAEFGATWELRCGPQNQYRVFYDVDDVAHTVFVLAVGVKTGNRLWIGGEAVDS